MPIYITLMKFTSQGMTGIPAWRDRVEEAERAIEARGGRFVDAYVTLGRYDVVEIFEAPDDETAYQILIEVAKHGQVTTETLRAFTREEAERIVRQLAAAVSTSDRSSRRTPVGGRGRDRKLGDPTAARRGELVDLRAARARGALDGERAGLATYAGATTSGELVHHHEA